jgi:hypothetical protein
MRWLVRRHVTYARIVAGKLATIRFGTFPPSLSVCRISRRNTSELVA